MLTSKTLILISDKKSARKERRERGKEEGKGGASKKKTMGESHL